MTCPHCRARQSLESWVLVFALAIATVVVVLSAL
jgi:hypothetical protein